MRRDKLPDMGCRLHDGGVGQGDVGAGHHRPGGNGVRRGVVAGLRGCVAVDDQNEISDREHCNEDVTHPAVAAARLRAIFTAHGAHFLPMPMLGVS